MSPHRLVPRHVLIDGVRIAYGVHGSKDERRSVPVVLIHGTPSSSYIWRNIVPPLVDAGHLVHVYDLLGYGLSERPWSLDVDTSVTGQVPILEGMLAHWGLEKAHIVAHDIGGAIAQRLAVFTPERLSSLTLIDVCSFDSWPSKRTLEQMHQGLDRLAKKPDADHRAHFGQWLLSTVVDRQGLTKGAFQTYLDFISGPVGQGSLFQHQVAHYDPEHTLEISDRLHELGDLAVQVIWGRDDAWQRVDWAHKIHAAIPGSTLHIIEDCGHFAMEDRPQAIARLLVDFISADSGAQR
ncbi:alpha/beta fold hydrolase [Thioalkalivibrio sp. HK1]|uniref:alpha/beta fold hydrolase n=1 Tax=Thioalkalivibrio sp. HK1 TaxID=1469245 RepID=UPI000472F844|nr:alpha/beta hydrolase [Thioalkalivibrio sp. HK1]